MNIESVDHNVIQACIKGDSQAQRKLFDCYKGRMMTICRRYSRDYSEAEDLLLISFNRVFRYLGKYKGKGNFYSWMKRITINVCLRYLEKNKRHFHYDEISETPEVNVEIPSAIDKLSEEEILNLIQKMPEGYRTIFNMNVIDGFSHVEIADKLDIASSTSRTQLLKARKWLKKRIEMQSNFEYEQ